MWLSFNSSIKVGWKASISFWWMRCLTCMVLLPLCFVFYVGDDLINDITVGDDVCFIANKIGSHIASVLFSPYCKVLVNILEFLWKLYSCCFFSGNQSSEAS